MNVETFPLEALDRRSPASFSLGKHNSLVSMKISWWNWFFTIQDAGLQFPAWQEFVLRSADGPNGFFSSSSSFIPGEEIEWSWLKFLVVFRRKVMWLGVSELALRGFSHYVRNSLNSNFFCEIMGIAIVFWDIATVFGNVLVTVFWNKKTTAF